MCLNTFSCHSYGSWTLCRCRIHSFPHSPAFHPEAQIPGEGGTWVLLQNGQCRQQWEDPGARCWSCSTAPRHIHCSCPGAALRTWCKSQGTGSLAWAMSARPFEGIHSPMSWNDKLLFNSRPHREQCFSVFMASNKHSNCLLYSEQPNSSCNVIIIEKPS